MSDLLEQTRKRLRQEKIQTVEDVRANRSRIVEPGPEVRELKDGLERFLVAHVYSHYRVQRMAAKGRRLLQSLFSEFCRRPELLPERYAVRARGGQLQRTVCDYVAGMTDRYAQQEYQSLFQPYHGV